MAENKNVTIYSTDTCHFCNLAKEFFSEHHVSYTDYNVGTDLEKRREMVERTGQLGVPVIMIGDDIIVGFDRSRIASLLGVQ